MPKGIKGFQKGNQLAKGKKVSKETRRKISKAKRGKPNPLLKGKHPSTEFKKGHTVSIETRKKISKGHKGKFILGTGFQKGIKHPNWRGGTSFEPYSIDWTETLKRAIRERDNYICQLCSQYGNTVHHIDYNKQNCNPVNLITVCKICNLKVNKNRNYWQNYFKIKMAQKHYQTYSKK